jgi:hypothetical protein
MDAVRRHPAGLHRASVPEAIPGEHYLRCVKTNRHDWLGSDFFCLTQYSTLVPSGMYLLHSLKDTHAPLCSGVPRFSCVLRLDVLVLLLRAASVMPLPCTPRSPP